MNPVKQAFSPTRENYFEWLNVLLKMLNKPVLSRC